jgi:hypothetical protein
MKPTAARLHSVTTTAEEAPYLVHPDHRAETYAASDRSTAMPRLLAFRASSVMIERSRGWLCELL